MALFIKFPCLFNLQGLYCLVSITSVTEIFIPLESFVPATDTNTISFMDIN